MSGPNFSGVGVWKWRGTFGRIHYLVLLTRPWGDGDSLFTVGLCLITEDFWSTSARGARAPGGGTTHIRNHKPGRATTFKLRVLLSYHVKYKRAVDCVKRTHTWNLLKLIYCWSDTLLEVLESIITTREVKGKSNRDGSHTTHTTHTHTGVPMVLLVVTSHISSIEMWGHTEDSLNSNYISDVMHEGNKEMSGWWRRWWATIQGHKLIIIHIELMLLSFCKWTSWVNPFIIILYFPPTRRLCFHCHLFVGLFGADRYNGRIQGFVFTLSMK